MDQSKSKETSSLSLIQAAIRLRIHVQNLGNFSPPGSLLENSKQLFAAISAARVLIYKNKNQMEAREKRRVFMASTISKPKKGLSAAVPAIVSMPAPASTERSVPVCIIPRTMTILDASRYLSTTTWQIEELLRKNVVPSFILGQRRVIDRLDLDRFVDQRKAEPPRKLEERSRNFKAA